jgi:hypothetical protein
MFTITSEEEDEPEDGGRVKKLIFRTKIEDHRGYFFG